MVIGLYSVTCMCTFKVSNKPNVLNLRYKFCPSPPRRSEGGDNKMLPPPLHLFLYTPSLYSSLCMSFSLPSSLYMSFLSTFFSVHVLPLYIPLCTCPSFLPSCLHMSLLFTVLSVHSISPPSYKD